MSIPAISAAIVNTVQQSLPKVASPSVAAPSSAAPMPHDTVSLSTASQAAPTHDGDGDGH